MPGKRIPLPFISGGDIAGTIAEIGPDVFGLTVGDRVVVDPAIERGAIGEDTPGGLAEYLRIPASNIIPLPSHASFDETAALPIAYGAAWRMLITRGAVRPLERVLILGAAGGVGTACVQLAKLAGCIVYAAVSSEEKLAWVRELGADHLINYREVEFDREVWRLTSKRGVDVVVDSTGADTWVRSLRSLRKGGRLLTCGATTGYDPRTDIRYIWARELTIIGSDRCVRSELEAVLQAAWSGLIRPVIHRTLPLAQTAEGHRLLEEREAFGKVIIHPQE